MMPKTLLNKPISMDHLWTIKEKGNTVELVGKEDLEGTPVYKLKVTLKTGEVRYFFLDAENYLDLKITRTSKREGVPK